MRDEGICIRGRAPKKICYFGDYLDIFGGHTLTIAINLGTWVTITGNSAEPTSPLVKHVRDEYGLSSPLGVEIQQEGPAGAGLGSSASVAVALTATMASLAGVDHSRYETAKLAHKFENDIGWICGPQDHFASTFGGLHLFAYRGNRVYMKRVESNLYPILVYCGERRRGSKRFQEVRGRFTPNILDRLREITLRGADSLGRGDIDEVGEASNEFFEVQRQIGLTTPKIEKLMQRAVNLGAYGGKVSGWGFGGCMVIWAEGDRKLDIIGGLREAGGISVEYLIDNEGIQLYPGVSPGDEMVEKIPSGATT